MKAKKRIKLQFFICVLAMLVSVAMGSVCRVRADDSTENIEITDDVGELAEESEAAEDDGASNLIESGKEILGNGVDAIESGAAQIGNLGLAGVRKVIQLIPFIGVGLFLVGIVVAVFSTRNKGNKRWGLKLAITEVILTYVLYVVIILIYDFALRRYPVMETKRPAEQSVYDKIYYDVIDEMKADQEEFILLKKGWTNKAIVAGRRVVSSVAVVLIFSSLSVGVLLLIVTRTDRATRRFALAGMCIVLPVTLIVVYQYLKV